MPSTRMVEIMPNLAAALLAGLAAAAPMSLPAAAMAEPGSCPAHATEIVPGQSIQGAIDQAGEGAAFCLKAGVHRMQQVVPKNAQSFHGESGAILSGAHQITTSERDGALWVASGQTQHHPKHGQCARNFPTCNMPDVLFIDDRPLQRVLRKRHVAQGRFHLDHASGRLYFADDPQGRKVEATVAQFAFAGRARDVVIRNLVVEKYASPAQYGAVNGREAQDWVVERVEARWNSGAGISIGSGGRVLDSNVHHNGQLGIRVIGTGVTLEGNRIWHNNTMGFDDAWEAGGVKITESERVVVRRNHVHDNAGTGLWCDINCRDLLYENNITERNGGPGIFHEISFNAVIRNNILRHNGVSGYRWFWNADIQIAASEHVEVYGNDIVVNAGGRAIMLIDQGRAPQGRWYQEYQTRSNYVHHNRITFEGDGSAGGASDTGPWDDNYNIIPRAQNLFDFNSYRAPTGASVVFAWGRRQFEWAAFQAQGQERNGSLIFE
jgi:hypothetical protein